VHDEVIVSCPIKNAKRGFKIVYNSMMEAGKNLTVPIGVDCKFGRTWGEAHGDGIKLEDL
jgi:DNA polymerase I-like protein with 3'-5' exonuclease and polymerase domains